MLQKSAYLIPATPEFQVKFLRNLCVLLGVCVCVFSPFPPLTENREEQEKGL